MSPKTQVGLAVVCVVLQAVMRRGARCVPRFRICFRRTAAVSVRYRNWELRVSLPVLVLVQRRCPGSQVLYEYEYSPVLYEYTPRRRKYCTSVRVLTAMTAPCAPSTRTLRGTRTDHAECRLQKCRRQERAAGGAQCRNRAVRCSPFAHPSLFSSSPRNTATGRCEQYS